MVTNNHLQIWSKRREIYLDYLRLEYYEFSDPSQAYGEPKLENDELEIYGWSNVPYDPDQDTQSRRVLVLKPEDLGGYKFDFTECETRTYPDQVVDAHSFSESGIDYIEEPTPSFEGRMGYKLVDIPDRVHPTKDNIRFKDAQCHGGSIELYNSSGNLKDRVNIDHIFSTYTLIDMYREIDGFNFPNLMNEYLVANEI